MKFNIPFAIIVAGIIIAIAIYLTSLNDPLANCMNKVIADGWTSQFAAKFCTGG